MIAPDKIAKTDAEWRARLTPGQLDVTRRHGTSPLNAEKRAGVYACVCCSEQLFASDAKFNSGAGWPSFDKPADGAALKFKPDDT